MQPHRQQATRLPCPWDSPGKNTGVGCHFLLQCMKVKRESEVGQSCPTLSDPMDCSLPGSSVHGIFQARVLEWGAIAFSDDKLRQHIKKQRHYFANKDLSSQSFGFSSSHVWMWELDIKKAESQRIYVFELWCWRRLLRVSWTSRRSKESILEEINPVYSLKGLMLKLKLQYFGHLKWRVNSFEKTLMLGKIEVGRQGDDRGWDVGWHHWLNGHEFEQTPGDTEGQGRMAYCSPWVHKESDGTEQLKNNNRCIQTFICFHAYVHTWPNIRKDSEVIYHTIQSE